MKDKDKEKLNKKRDKKRKKAIIKFKYNFSTLIVITAAVMIWRSLWNFADAYLFPDHFILSNMLTLIWGLIIIFLDKNFDLDDVL